MAYIRRVVFGFGYFFALTAVWFAAQWFIQPLQAQKNNPVLYKSEAIELNIDAIYAPCEDPINPLCQPYPTGTQHPNPAKQDHEMGLSSGDLPPNTQVYIVGCVDSATGTRCTTGDPQLDTYLNGIPGGDFMNPDTAHEFTVLQNPAVTDSTGELRVIARSYTPNVTRHLFNAYMIETQNASPTSSLSITPAKSVKLETLEVITDTPVPTRRPPRRTTNRDNNQDPKGRIFDAKSLEPLSNAQISLMDSFQKLFTYQSLINPQTVKSDGEFAFYVPNGQYYLNLSQLPATHTWPVDMKIVSPNYIEAYFCDPDIKDGNNQPAPIYYQSFPITVADKLIHCDIPVDPGDNPPFKSQIQTITYGVSRESRSGSITYSGKVSHPLTKIQLVGQASNKLAAETTADKFGFWQVSIQAANHPRNSNNNPDRIVLNYLKKDLTQATYEPATPSMIIEPLLNYLEGYVYDQSGEVIPLAKVGIKAKNSDQITYLTVADNQGFFQIGSKYLPSLEYELVFVNSQDEIYIVTTSQFIALNNQYLQQKKLDLVTTKVNDLLLNNSGITGPKSVNAINQKVISPTNPPMPTETANTGKRILAFIYFLILFVITVIFVWQKFIKKKSAPIENPPIPPTI